MTILYNKHLFHRTRYLNLYRILQKLIYSKLPVNIIIIIRVKYNHKFSSYTTSTENNKRVLSMCHLVKSRRLKTTTLKRSALKQKRVHHYVRGGVLPRTFTSLIRSSSFCLIVHINCSQCSEL